MNWEEYFKIGSYIVWKALDENNKPVYTMHYNKPLPEEGGYYSLSWLLKVKGY
jgi:hypothetical protein